MGTKRREGQEVGDRTEQ